jgi:plastocyanin
MMDAMKRILILLVVGAGIAALAGCGGGSGASSGTATAPRDANVVNVSIKNILFNPSDITVKVGQKLVWKNDDPVAHDVVAEKGGTFRSEVLANGDTFSFTPTKPGTIDYVCTIHNGQKGRITVTQ